MTFIFQTSKYFACNQFTKFLSIRHILSFHESLFIQNQALKGKIHAKMTDIASQGKYL